jgi:hypothetical protein
LLRFESNGSHRHTRVTLLDHHALSGARRSLRARLNARRLALSPTERAQRSALVARNAAHAVHLKAHARIALYAALPWELDAEPLMALAAERGCRIYLPRIERSAARARMRFAPMHEVLSGVNRLGILEPTGATHPRRRAGSMWCSCRLSDSTARPALRQRRQDFTIAPSPSGTLARVARPAAHRPCICLPGA